MCKGTRRSAMYLRGFRRRQSTLQGNMDARMMGLVSERADENDDEIVTDMKTSNQPRRKEMDERGDDDKEISKGPFAL